MMDRLKSSGPVGIVPRTDVSFVVIGDEDLDQVTGAIAPVLLYAAAAGLAWGLAAGYLSNR